MNESNADAALKPHAVDGFKVATGCRSREQQCSGGPFTSLSLWTALLKPKSAQCGRCPRNYPIGGHCPHHPKCTHISFSWLSRKWKTSFKSSCQSSLKTHRSWTALVAQWLRICLPMQGTQVRSWSGKIPHAMDQLSPCATTTEPAL